MVKDIKVSKPISMETPPSRLYEYAPLGKQDSVINSVSGPRLELASKKKFHFLTRDATHGEVWKSATQRDRIFGEIWSAEHENIADRTVIEVEELTDTACSYSYSDRSGKRIQKQVPIASIVPSKEALEGSSESSKGIREDSTELLPPEEGGAPANIPTMYKVQELSLRQFKQVEISNAIIEFLKAIIEFLATPFCYLYQLIAGSGEPRDFAAMLTPVLHDRVGGVNHKAVLSQLRFAGRLFSEEDPICHGKGLIGLPQETGQIIYFNGENRPCRDAGDCYEIWIDGQSETIENPHFNNFKEDGQKDLRETITIDRGPTFIQFKSNDPLLETENFKFTKIKQYNESGALESIKRETVSHEGDSDIVDIGFKNEWVKIPKNHSIINGFGPYDAPQHTLNDSELNPEVISGTQQMARIFYDGYNLSTKMQNALDSGNKKEIKKTIVHLSETLADLPTRHHALLTISQGEGKNYVPHFFIFVHNPSTKQTFLKHLCFSSTSLDNGKIQVLRTYDVTATLTDDAQRLKMARSLFHMQAYTRGKDAQEVSIKGPMIRDKSLDSLLLQFGTEVVSHTGPIEKKVTRDPVRAIYSIIEELGIEENKHLALEDQKLEQLTASKGKFYTAYVNHLIGYYEENEHKLTAEERAHALDGLVWYVQRVRHFMEKEISVDAAGAITNHLIAFIDKKLDELGRSEALEKDDINNLKNKATLFRATLQEELSKTMQRVELKQEVEGSRVGTLEWGRLVTIRNELIKTTLTRDERVEVHKKLHMLLQRAQLHLNNNPLAAKTLLLAIMEALPAAKNPDDADAITFWDTLDDVELSDWIATIDSIALKMFDGSLRTATFPLKPHEVFEFNVVLPLLQRHLFTRKIAFNLEKLEGDHGILKTYMQGAAGAQLVQRMDQERLRFQQAREKEIEEETKEELEEKWQQEDEKDKAQWNTYLAKTRIWQTAFEEYEKHASDPHAHIQHPHPGAKPTAPTITADSDKAIIRKKELEDEIVKRKNTDGFLNELQKIYVARFDESWNLWMSMGSPRLQAVMGRFAKMMGISKELYAYKLAGEGWIDASFESKEKALWLMRKDCSVLVGSSPAFEKRYSACKMTLNSFTEMNIKPQNSAEQAANFLIGYNELGDGTQLGPDENYEEFVALIGEHQKGFFEVGHGSNSLVPEEGGRIRRIDEMRKILRNPTKYLSPFHDGSNAAARIMGMIGDEPLSEDSLKKKFVEMSEIHLVAALRTDMNGSKDGCFTISEKPTLKGSLATNGVKEEPADHLERQKYMGQATPQMVAQKVGGDHEREKVQESIVDRLYKALDPAQEFILRATALSKATNDEELSFLAITQCMHFIYQYPEKLAIPQVRDTLYKTLFQHGLIKKLLMLNPEFFVRFGKVLNEICLFLQKKESLHRVSEIFLREVSERIRRHAFEMQDELHDNYGQDFASQIAVSLPVYDETSILGIFRQKMSEKDQKVFATFALSYFCHKFSDGVKDNAPNKFPSFNDIDGWRDLLFAYFILQKSPFEAGHSGMQAELLYKVQKDLLPRVAYPLSHAQGSAFRTDLLGQLSGKLGMQWNPNPDKPYSYFTQEGNQTFEIDIRTGKGFKDIIKLGERCKLPEQIRMDQEFKFLFHSMDPMVTSKAGEEGIVDYHWLDEHSGSEFLFRYKQDDRTFQIFQVVDGKKYQFQRINLKENLLSKAWHLFARHNNRTIEKMIAQKGVWVPVDENGVQDSSKVLVAQHGWNLGKDPVTLNIKKNKIVGATLGKGEKKKWICSGLASKDSKLLSFRSGNDLLLLSKDKRHVDEIRFPPDPITKEQLILQRSNQDADVWVVSGREDWTWKLKNTKTYEDRFGKNYRDYILPLKNIKTGEEEIWIFPHLPIGCGKGNEIKFLKNAGDFIDAAGGALSESGITQGVDMENLRMLVGSLENLTGGADTLIEQMQNMGSGGAEEKHEEIYDLLKNLATPRAIQYRINRRSETSSHIGFFYLAHTAALRGDWGTANRYAEMIVEGGYSTAEDLKQLQKLSLIILSSEILLGGKNQPFAPKSAMENAFRAKLAVILLTLNTRLKAQHGIEIFPKDEEKGDLKILMQIGGALAYLEYRKSLATHSQQYLDHGLLLTKQEESVLTSSIALLGGAVAAKEKALEEIRKEKPKKAHPFAFPIPSDVDMKKMVKAMAEYVEPNGVLSIHHMHKEHGSYPKWETVLANFWVYWEWIYRNDLNVEDISFLLREIPKADKLCAEIDTARRTLIIFWHYCKQERFKAHRKSHNVAEEALLREVKTKRLDMPDFASMESKKRRLAHEASMSPSVVKTLYAKGYEVYVEFRRSLNEFTYRENVGGVSHIRGIKNDFVQVSSELLTTFLGEAFTLEREGGLVIHPDVLALAKEYHTPKENRKLDPLKEAKTEAWNDFLSAVKKVNKQLARDLKNKKEDIKCIFDAFLYLPNFNESVDRLFEELPAILGSTNNGLFSSAVQIEQFKTLFDQLKLAVAPIHERFAEAAGLPKSAYPKELEKGIYETVEVLLPEKRPQWDEFFVDSLLTWKNGEWKEKESVWEKRKAIAKGYFDPESAENDRERHTLENTCKGIDEACIDLKKRTGSSLNITALKRVYENLSKEIKDLGSQGENMRAEILYFAKKHAQELGITYLFADRVRITDEQIIQKIMDLYAYGQLGRLDDIKLQSDYAQLITESILVTTEMQQYIKAQGVCKDLLVIWKKIQGALPDYMDGPERSYIAQSIANNSVDWILYSADLKRCLEEGSNRLRYTEEKNGKHYLKDQKFARRYLLSDVRNHWISRAKAIKTLEDLLKDLREAENQGKPIRCVKAKMGTGKSDWVLPNAFDLSIQEGYEPIVITTDDLIDQLRVSMGSRAFVFKFSIEFGLDALYAGELASLDESKRRERWDAIYTSNGITEHLETLCTTLENLKKEKKVVLTSPSQIASLRDKRVQLQGLLSIMKPGKARNEVFKQLQLLKRIGEHFKKENNLYFLDEDVNFDISHEFNFATGDYHTVDPVRFDVAERMFRTIMDHHPDLWKLIVNNNLRALRDVSVEFRDVVRSLFRDTQFWTTVGWDKNEWLKINEEEFIDYILGLRKDLPTNMPDWNKDIPEEQQQEKAYVAALKTFLAKSKTMDSVRGINPKMERGVSKSNGVTVVPFSDGEEKRGVLYGELSENILNHVIHYCGAGNWIGEEIFFQKYKDLGGLDLRISPHYSETWKDWGDRIARITNKNNDPQTGKPYLSEHDAFIKDPELSLQRMQFLRHIMLETDFIKVYEQQINFNSQDLGLWGEIRLVSGTGEVYALNLLDYTDESVDSPDVVLGETLLCLDLDEETATFTGTPLEHIEERAKDPQCLGVINFDYEVYRNDNEKLVAKLRQTTNRQMIYRVEEDQQLVKKMWNPGEHFFPMNYEPGAIKRDSVFVYYSRREGRGVHFEVPRGGDKFGDLMVGAGNPADGISQACWRFRHLGTGQKLKLSQDMKTEVQVRNACPPNTEEAWNKFKKIISESVPHNIKIQMDDSLNRHKDRLLPYIKAYLQNPEAEKAFHDFLDKVPEIADILGKEFEKTLAETMMAQKKHVLAIRNLKVGHSMRYFTKNSTEQQDVYNVKATIFKEQKALKTYIEAEVGKRYDMRGIQDSTCIEEIEGNAVCKATRALYYLSNRSRWEHEYQAHRTVEPIEFVRGLCVEEIKKIELMRDEFVKSIHLVINENKQASFLKDYKLLQWADQFIGKGEDAVFENELSLLLNNHRFSASPEKLAVAREIIRKYYYIMKAFDKAEKDVAEEICRLDDENYQTYLKNNLPKEISVDLNEGSRNEQKTQQLQEQKQTQKTQKVERVMVPVGIDKPTEPIDYNHFKQVIAGHKHIIRDKWNSTFHWKENGNVLPVSIIAKQELGVRFPKEYENVYVSERAWRLLNKTGRGGAPVVELLVIDDGKEKHSVIITPAEREESVATAMMAERGSARLDHEPIVLTKPSFDEEKAWKELRTILMDMAGILFGGMIGAVLNDGNKPKIMPYLRQFLTTPDPEKAFSQFSAAIPDIANILGFAQFTDMLQGSVNNYKNALLAFHKQYCVNVSTGPQSTKDKVKLEKVAIYALSNEHFSRMIIDAGSQLPREDDQFVKNMVMNKLFVNWTQFTLEELEFLISYINSFPNPSALVRCFTTLLGDEITQDIETGDQVKGASKTVQLLNNIINEDQEWFLKFAIRKLEENYPNFREVEGYALEAWLKRISYPEYFSQLTRLKTLGANNSVRTLEYIYKRVFPQGREAAVVPGK